MHSISKHAQLRKEHTASTCAKAAGLQQLKHQQMPPLERVTSSRTAQPAFRWGSEAGIRAVVEAAGARLWDMPRDNDCAFHMYTRQAHATSVNNAPMLTV